MSKSTTTRSAEDAALQQLMEAVKKLSVQVTTMQDQLEVAEKERREAILARDEADRRAEAMAERYSDEIAALEERLEQRFGERLENALQTRPPGSSDGGRIESGGSGNAIDIAADDNGSGDRSRGQSAARARSVKSLNCQQPQSLGSAKDFPEWRKDFLARAQTWRFDRAVIRRVPTCSGNCNSGYKNSFSDGTDTNGGDGGNIASCSRTRRLRGKRRRWKTPSAGDHSGCTTLS